jgi:hypothetical protein
MNIQIYSDDTKGDNNNFMITTTIWGSSVNCRFFEKEIENLVLDNIRILGKDFKGFHANKLNARNWKSLSMPYQKLLNKLVDFIKSDYLRLMIFMESKEKYNSNSAFLEETLKKYLLDRDNPFGKMFKYISEKDLIAIYKRADVFYNYFLHRDIFGGPNQYFEYYPDSSGKILKYRSEKRFVESSGLSSGIQLLMSFYDIVRLIGNNFAKALNEMGWKKPVGQELVKFEPLRDEDSFIIQSADIISNIFFNLIKFLIGVKGPNLRTIEEKAKLLLSYNILDENILNNIKKSFKLHNEKCICSDSDLKAKFLIKYDLS